MTETETPSSQTPQPRAEEERLPEAPQSEPGEGSGGGEGSAGDPSAAPSSADDPALEPDELPPEPGDASPPGEEELQASGAGAPSRASKREVVREPHFGVQLAQEQDGEGLAAPGSVESETSAAPVPARSKSKDALIEVHRELIGVLPDAEVARRAGVSTSAVFQYRKRLGIEPSTPARNRGKKKDSPKAPRKASAASRKQTGRAKQKKPGPAPTPAPVPASTPATTPPPVRASAPPRAPTVQPTPAAAAGWRPGPSLVFGWQVQLQAGPEAIERVVFAATAAQAALLAAQCGEVLSLTRLAQALG